MMVQVLGGGGWGIALSRLLSLNSHDVHLWMRDPAKARQLQDSRENRELLPGVCLPAGVHVATTTAVDADMVVYVVPSHALRETASALSFPARAIRVSAVKGIENGSLLRMSQVLKEIAPDAPAVVLSGPSHAEEVGRGLPACVVAAGDDENAVGAVQRAFGCPSFRVYTSDDVIGVELGGALKNVVAIAAGACEELGLGDNAKAALITRGLAEMMRLGLCLGARSAAFAGLGGLGDLVVTCSSRHSRNHQVGRWIAAGKTLDDILNASVKVAEGIRTAQSVMQLAERHAVEMPIAEAVYDVLFNGADVRQRIEALMTRLMKAEWA